MNSNDIIFSMPSVTVSTPSAENISAISQENKTPALVEQDTIQIAEETEHHEAINRPQVHITLPLECDDQRLGIPKINSLGKVTEFKCKKCTYVAITKVDFWEHNKVQHIPTNKQLPCAVCPFVTEHRHHLTYHARKHAGYKPFKCSQCEYSCHTKSLLTSHLKSHSNNFQYHCQDCTYASKHCHPLKLHLRKYNHKPAIALNADGSPNPLAFIDVFGKRRKRKEMDQEQNHVSDHQPNVGPTLPYPQSQTKPNMSSELPTPLLDVYGKRRKLKERNQDQISVSDNQPNVGSMLPFPQDQTRPNMSSQMLNPLLKVVYKMLTLQTLISLRQEAFPIPNVSGEPSRESIEEGVPELSTRKEWSHDSSPSG